MSVKAQQEGGQALAALDRALSHKPRRDGEAFSEATEHLCRMRDALIASRRDGVGDRQLERLNAVISSALAGHFPLGNTPWPEVEKAREDLRGLLAEA